MRLKFENIAHNITEKRNPVPEDSKLYVGLEHMDAGSLYITRYGLDVDIKGSKLVMRKGDVLLGKRNAYLRRAAIAPHDGLFSAHGMILRPKEDVIDKNFFPFFVASDKFFDEVIRISVGGLSPTVNWKDLKNLEFDLPPLSEQKILADKLWAAYRLKESYKKLLAATDEMVKSRFIEMFGDNSGCHKEPLNDHVQEMFIGPFGSALKNEYFVDDETRYCVVYEQKHAIDKDITVPFRYINESKYRELKRFTVLPGDIIVSCRGTVGKVFLIPEGAPMGVMHPSIMKIRLKDDYLAQFFIFALVSFMDERERLNVGTGVKMAVSATDLGKELFPLPSLEEQEKFVSIVQQADKSKFELRKSIEAIDAVIKSLINN